MDLLNLFKKETLEEKIAKAEVLSKEIENLFLEYKSNLIIYKKELIYYKKIIDNSDDMKEIYEISKKINKIISKDIPNCMNWYFDDKFTKLDSKLSRLGICKIKGKVWTYDRTHDGSNFQWLGDGTGTKNVKHILTHSYGHIM